MKPVRGIQHEYIRDAKNVDRIAFGIAALILGAVAFAVFKVTGIGIEHISQTIGG